MRIISQNSQFVFFLPYDMFPAELNDKYKPFFKKNRVQFNDLADYINFHIKSVEMPGFGFETPKTLAPYGKEILHKPAIHDQNLFGNTMKIQFKDVDSHVLRIMMLDIIRYHYSDTKKKWLPTISYYIVDIYGDAIFKVSFREVICTRIGSMVFSYSDQKVENKEFELEFKYNWVDIDFVLTDQSDMNGDLMLSYQITPEDNPRPK